MKEDFFFLLGGGGGSGTHIIRIRILLFCLQNFPPKHQHGDYAEEEIEATNLTSSLPQMSV